jgi:transcriptional regulator with XRE-family HTH domain
LEFEKQVPRTRITRPVGPEAELFGERLRELRQKRKLTLRALCDTAGMSLAYLSDLERGLKVPSLTTLVRLAVALDCKVTALVSVFDKADLRSMLPK